LSLGYPPTQRGMGVLSRSTPPHPVASCHRERTRGERVLKVDEMYLKWSWSVQIGQYTPSLMSWRGAKLNRRFGLQLTRLRPVRFDKNSPPRLDSRITRGDKVHVQKVGLITNHPTHHLLHHWRQLQEYPNRAQSWVPRLQRRRRRILVRSHSTMVCC
jgi:hypothetical protein